MPGLIERSEATDGHPEAWKELLDTSHHIFLVSMGRGNPSRVFLGASVYPIGTILVVLQLSAWEILV